EDRGELRRREDRAEKKRDASKREDDRKAERREREEERRIERRERAEERRQREERKEAERKAREREKVLAAIVKLPSAQHEAEPKKAAGRRAEDVEPLHAEFDELLGDEAEKIRRGIVEPWDEPVATRETVGCGDGAVCQVHHCSRQGCRTHRPAVD